METLKEELLKIARNYDESAEVEGLYATDNRKRADDADKRAEKCRARAAEFRALAEQQPS